MTSNSLSPEQISPETELRTFVGRQPIFDSKMNVFAYELLFRSGFDNMFHEFDGDSATSRVISDCFFTLGLTSITGGKRASINFTRNVLLSEYAQLLPREALIVEILEDVEPDAEVIEAVRNLKNRGYIIALDDYKGGSLQNPFFEFVDIVKVDFTLTDPEQRVSLVEEFRPKKVQLLAEKVETREEFESAMKAGFTLFQGYFFCKPSIVTGARVPAFKLSKIQLLKEVNRSVFDLAAIEKIFKQDVGLSYRLFRYINSAYFSLRRQVDSIRHGLMLLGQKNLRKWSSVIAIAALGSDKPSELLITSMVRARFCELLAEHVGMNDRSEDLFLLGMFSTIDVLLDMPMSKALAEIPLADDLTAALQGEENPLRNILEMTITYEVGDWERFSSISSRYSIDEERIPLLHHQAVRMASEMQVLQADKSE